MSSLRSHLLPLSALLLVIAGGVFVVLGSNGQLFHKKAAPTSALDRAIAQAEQAVALHPPRTSPYTSLASLYIQKARETADASYYDKMDAALSAAAKVDAQDPDIPALKAAAENGRHHFKEAAALIATALDLNPTRPAYWGLAGDAAIELGKYDEAAADFQKMIDLRPGFNSWSRVAYIRELYGQIPGAKEALRQAISSGSEYPENIAWAYVELGKLDLRDNPDAAKEDFTHALAALPSYAPALEGLGRLAYFAGDTAEAKRQFAAAYAIQPLAQHAVDLGELDAVALDPAGAAQQYALARAAFTASAKSGVDVDLEQSLFESEHDVDVPDALLRATRAYAERPSAYAADYLAWALYKSGKVADARSYKAKALALGQTDPLILYHEGMIAIAAGEGEEGRGYLTAALRINPRFSILDVSAITTALKTH